MKQETFIDPLAQLGASLFSIEKPARYLGGEIGSSPRVEPGDPRLRIALCFPDLYEIGMSNNAIRILYNDLKGQEGLVCERVFAPAPDYESLLMSRGVPLHTLESGIPLSSCDILGFSIGYELAATNILTILERGGIPLLTKGRAGTRTVVLAGGPAVSNPHPFSDFLDAAYIGEAESEFYKLVGRLAEAKRKGGGRSELLRVLASSRSVWISPALAENGELPASITKRLTVRAIAGDFSWRSASTAYPVPVIPTVQSHGTVEIMRGCPNGCRFCHAGYYYRPQRIKSQEAIDHEISSLVQNGGYREITLASLSSGDFPGIGELLERLNQTWKSRSVSFQLPSLKIESFDLELLGKLAEVRKSGLTFAVETALPEWQRSINKIADVDKIKAIVSKASSFGFRSAKFYFMIGLPVDGRGMGEANAIIELLGALAGSSKIQFNANVGVFVPKPHTPYQREGQLGEREALEAIYHIKDSLRRFRNVAVSYHSPFTAVLEGIIARGDRGVGDLILRAYREGARLDAWDEHLDKDLWRRLIREYALEAHSADPFSSTFGELPEVEAPPWADIAVRVSNSYLSGEASKSELHQMTACCEEECENPCGACSDTTPIVLNTAQHQPNNRPIASSRQAEPRREFGFSVQTSEAGDGETANLQDRRLVISFERKNIACFYPLHSYTAMFSRLFNIMEIPVRYTEGFNPQPRMELTPPLSMGAAGENEILAVWLQGRIAITDISLLLDAINSHLPLGVRATALRIGRPRAEGKNSIGSLYWGASYRITIPSGIDAKLDLRAIPNFFAVRFRDEGESVEVAEAENAVIVTVNDAHGGKKNFMHALSEYAGNGNPFQTYSVTREKVYAMKDGRLTAIFEIL